MGVNAPRGLLANWFDLAEGADERFDFWHNREHVIERLNVPGFVSARRYSALDGDPAPGQGYLMVYDTEELSVLESRAYALRLDNPTELTRGAVPLLRNVTRTAYELYWSAGAGMGAFLATIRPAPISGGAGKERQLLETRDERL